VDNIWLKPFDGSKPAQPITHFKNGTILSFDWSHDGKSLAVVRQDATSDVILLRDTTTAK
jgi:hypothetical protein